MWFCWDSTKPSIVWEKDWIHMLLLVWWLLDGILVKCSVSVWSQRMALLKVGGYCLYVQHCIRYKLYFIITRTLESQFALLQVSQDIGPPNRVMCPTRFLRTNWDGSCIYSTVIRAQRSHIAYKAVQANPSKGGQIIQGAPIVGWSWGVSLLPPPPPLAVAASCQCLSNWNSPVFCSI